MENNLKDKVVVITGAAKGIGFACAELFLRHGAKVAFCDLNKGDIQKAVKRLDEFGEVFALQADVRKETDIRRFSKELLTRFRRVDILVNNAGILPRRGLFYKHTFSQINNTIDTNLKGTLFMTKALLSRMLKSGSGVIINLSSEAGLTGYGEMSAYCATKFGIMGFSEALDEELSDNGIKVYAVCPGAVKTALNSGFTGEKPVGIAPEKVAELIVTIAGTMPVSEKCFRI
jgi:3alpha(or 20beta)-hydroxysteroid dehydrogenase